MRKHFRKWTPHPDGEIPGLRWCKLCKKLAANRYLWGLNRRALAGGIALGLFVGLTPTVGAQMLLSLGGAVFFRVNAAAAFIALWVSNPITTPALYWFFNRLGAMLFADWLPAEKLAKLAPAARAVVEQSAYMWLGSLLVASVGAAAGYFLFSWFWRLSIVRRWRSRHLNRHHTSPQA